MEIPETKRFIPKGIDNNIELAEWVYSKHGGKSPNVLAATNLDRWVRWVRWAA